MRVFVCYTFVPQANAIHRYRLERKRERSLREVSLSICLLPLLLLLSLLPGVPHGGVALWSLIVRAGAGVDGCCCCSAFVMLCIVAACGVLLHVGGWCRGSERVMLALVLVLVLLLLA